MLNDQIGSILSPYLKQQGFKKKSSSWVRNENGVVQVIELQKSNHGHYYYINLSIQLEILSDHNYPQLVIRANELLDLSRGAELDRALAFEDENMSNEKRGQIVLVVLSQAVLPFFETVNTQDKIRDILRVNSMLRNRSSKVLVNYLEAY